MKVKAIIILIAITLVVFSPSSLLAQEATNIQSGIKVGIGLAKWTGEDATSKGQWNPGASYERTVAFGLFIGVSISDLMTLQPEVVYLRKSTSYLAGRRRYYYIIDYLDVPILAIFKLARSAKISPSLYAGPTISFKLNSEWEPTPEVSIYSRPELKNVNFIDFGVTVGASLGFGISRLRMSFDVRITQGISNITGNQPEFTDPEELILGGRQDLKNRVIYIMLGLAF